MRPLLIGGLLLIFPAMVAAQTAQVAPAPATTQQQSPWDLLNSANALAAGDGVPKDTARARKIFEQVMASSDPSAAGVAALSLGKLAESDLHDPALAARALERGIELGNPWCMVTRAQELAKGTPKELKRAVDLNLRAIEVADKPEVGKSAYYNLGQLYLQPALLSPKKAVDYHQRAADLGNSWSLIAIGSAYEKGLPGLKPKWTSARDAYEKALSADDARVKGAAALGLAELYSQRGHNAPKRAVGYLQQGQKFGNPWAAMKLADRYANGPGVKKDPAAARKLYEELRNSPDPAVAQAAALPLGRLYASTKPRNLKLAEENLVFAAGKGDVWATYFLAQFYLESAPSQANRQKARQLLRKLMASNDPVARRSASQMMDSIH